MKSFSAFFAVVLLCIVPVCTDAQWSTNPNVDNAIATTVKYERYPTIVSDGAGGAIIAWELTYAPGDIDIKAQRINSQGIVQWTTNGITVSNPL